MDEQKRPSNFFVYFVPFMFAVIGGVLAMQMNDNSPSQGILAFFGMLLLLLPGDLVKLRAAYIKPPTKISMIKEKPATIAIMIAGAFLVSFGFIGVTLGPVGKILFAAFISAFQVNGTQKMLNVIYEKRRKEGFGS